MARRRVYLHNHDLFKTQLSSFQQDSPSLLILCLPDKPLLDKWSNVDNMARSLSSEVTERAQILSHLQIQFICQNPTPAASLLQPASSPPFSPCDPFVSTPVWYDCSLWACRTLLVFWFQGYYIFFLLINRHLIVWCPHFYMGVKDLFWSSSIWRSHWVNGLLLKLSKIKSNAEGTIQW